MGEEQREGDKLSRFVSRLQGLRWWNGKKAALCVGDKSRRKGASPEICRQWRRGGRYGGNNFQRVLYPRLGFGQRIWGREVEKPGETKDV